MTNRLPLLAGLFLIAATSGGWIHGSTPPPPSYPDWHDALASIPCDKILPDGEHHIKVIGPLVVDSKIYIDHVVTNEREIEVVDARCHPKG